MMSAEAVGPEGSANGRMPEREAVRRVAVATNDGSGEIGEGQSGPETVASREIELVPGS